MSEVGSGVREIWIHVLGEWRVRGEHADALYVLQVFTRGLRKPLRPILS